MQPLGLYYYFLLDVILRAIASNNRHSDFLKFLPVKWRPVYWRLCMKVDMTVGMVLFILKFF